MNVFRYLFILGLSLHPEVFFLSWKYPSNLLSAEINFFFQTKISYCSISSFSPNPYKFNLLFFSLITPLNSFIFVLVILCPPSHSQFLQMNVCLTVSGKIHIPPWWLHCYTKVASVHSHNQWHQLSTSCWTECMWHFSSIAPFPAKIPSHQVSENSVFKIIKMPMGPTGEIETKKKIFAENNC